MVCADFKYSVFQFVSELHWRSGDEETGNHTERPTQASLSKVGNVHAAAPGKAVKVQSDWLDDNEGFFPFCFSVFTVT